MKFIIILLLISFNSLLYPIESCYTSEYCGYVIKHNSNTEFKRVINALLYLYAYRFNFMLEKIELKTIVIYNISLDKDGINTFAFADIRNNIIYINANKMNCYNDKYLASIIIHETSHIQQYKIFGTLTNVNKLERMARGIQNYVYESLCNDKKYNIDYMRFSVSKYMDDNKDEIYYDDNWNLKY